VWAPIGSSTKRREIENVRPDQASQLKKRRFCECRERPQIDGEEM